MLFIYYLLTSLIHFGVQNKCTQKLQLLIFSQHVYDSRLADGKVILLNKIHKNNLD